MQIWEIFKKSITWQICALVKWWENTRLLSEDMLLEEGFKMALAMELVTANLAHIKNKDTGDLHKMCMTKQSSAAV